MPIIYIDPDGDFVVQSAHKLHAVVHTERAAAGRAAWAALHSQHLGNPEWFAEWQKLIPTGCGCQQGANDLLAQCPPRYDSPEDWFAWTCQYHNLVNVKLGKPTLTLDEARAIWRP
jgi:hypothetical protein